MADDKIVEFISDNGREPKVPFHRAWPWGQDFDISRGEPSCKTELPWPAPHCGVMIVECKTCGRRDAFTVAGRVDDPCSVRVPCKIQHEAGHA